MGACETNSACAVRTFSPPDPAPVLTGVKVFVLAWLRALHLDPGCGRRA